MSYYRSTMPWKPVHPLAAAGVRRRLGMCCCCVSEVGPMSGHLHHRHWSTTPFFLFVWHFQTAAQLNSIGETISCKSRKQSLPTVCSHQVIFRPPASSRWHGQRWNPCTAASSISGVSPIHPADCQLKVFLFVFNWSCSCTGYYKHFRMGTREEAFLGSFPFTPNWLLQELH